MTNKVTQTKNCSNTIIIILRIPIDFNYNWQNFPFDFTQNVIIPKKCNCIILIK